MSKKATKSIEGDVLTVTFADDQALAINLADLPEEIVHRLAMHGLSQKVGDSYASTEAEECFAKAESVVKELIAGNWTTRVAGSGGTRITQLAKALAAVTKQDIATVNEFLTNASDDEKKDLRNHAQVKAELARMQQEAHAARAAKLAEEAANAGELSLG